MLIKVTNQRLRLILLSASFALLGNAPPSDIPAPLQPYVIDGVLKTDDFGWMRGVFDGASETQKAETEAIKLWLKECMATAKAKAVEELKAMGIAETTLDGATIGPAHCGSVATYNAMSEPTKNWDEFQSNEKRARFIFTVYKYGAEIARENSAFEQKWGTEESWDLLAATMMEQVYRRGHNWTNKEGVPDLDPTLEPYFHAHLGNAMQKADRGNTEMLKAIVEKIGWPSNSVVGERAAGNAWLLVQHADHDPAFQLKALRLMEPLAAKGDVSKRNYAYLYDRIMLKLSGKQRFGTQFGGCDGTEYKLRPLEDESRLDSLRSEQELPPIADYRKLMRDRNGPCRAS